MLIAHFKCILANLFCAIGILGSVNLPLDEAPLPHYKGPLKGEYF